MYFLLYFVKYTCCSSMYVMKCFCEIFTVFFLVFENVLCVGVN